MKLKLIPLLLCLCLVLPACSGNEAKRSKNPSDNTVVKTQDEPESDEKGTTVTDEAEAEAARSPLNSMISAFAGLDYENALLYIRESDRALLDFSNPNQTTLYDSLFSKLRCEAGRVYTDGGRTFVEADITAPDMLDVYGRINLRYLDAMFNGEIGSEDEAREFNNRTLAEVIEAEDLKYKTSRVDVEIMRDGDGEMRVVFTEELMNAMLGDIQTAQEQVSNAIEEGMTEYNAAKEAGAFEE